MNQQIEDFLLFVSSSCSLTLSYIINKCLKKYCFQGLLHVDPDNRKGQLYMCSHGMKLIFLPISEHLAIQSKHVCMGYCTVLVFSLMLTMPTSCNRVPGFDCQCQRLTPAFCECSSFWGFAIQEGMDSAASSHLDWGLAKAQANAGLWEVNQWI